MPMLVEVEGVIVDCMMIELLIVDADYVTVEEEEVFPQVGNGLEELLQFVVDGGVPLSTPLQAWMLIWCVCSSFHLRNFHPDVEVWKPLCLVCCCCEYFYFVVGYNCLGDTHCCWDFDIESASTQGVILFVLLLCAGK